jgi:hypothetical protein
MTKPRLKIVLLLALLACAPAAARAQGRGNPENWCRNGAFTDDAPPFALARVAGAKGERVYFRGDDGDCPLGPDAKCRLKSYLIPGDEVIVTRRYGRYVCAWFQPPKGGETVGWLPADKLAVRAVSSAPPTAAWVGEWRFYDNSISVRRDARTGRLRLEGQAFWKGLGDNVHVGEIGGEAAPRGDEIAVEEDECRVSLRLVGPFLVVNDNGRCGGLNVTFDGVYRKAAPRRR